MAKVVITCRIENAEEWEQKFRTHGSLLASMSQHVTHIGFSDDNHVAVYSEPEDLAKYLEVLESNETKEAMAMDGVDRESVRVFVLDREFQY
jgi:hypothetical protein